MQSQVPQFIEVEDRVVGPLTIKQTLYLAVPGLIIFALWFLIDSLTWFIIASIPIAAIGAAFAFLKINGRPFVYFILNIFGYTKAPKVMVWQRKTTQKKQKVTKKENGQNKTTAPPELTDQQSLAIERKRKGKIKDLSKVLDISK